MSASRRTRSSDSPGRGEGGYTLVEMVVGIGLAVVVGLGVYAVFTWMQRSGQSQKIYNDLQTSCNFAMDQMKGELQLAGYRAPRHANGSTSPIVSAGAHAITFEYFDDNARPKTLDPEGYDEAVHNENIEVTYRLAGPYLTGADPTPRYDLVREYRHFKPSTSEYDTDPAALKSQVLVSGIPDDPADPEDGLNFSYFTDSNSAWGSGNRLDIRTVRAELTCRATQPDPNKWRMPENRKYQNIALSAEVRARNIGVVSTSADYAPPATPTGLTAWDPGICGTLEVRWNANTEPDLEGYTIYYGLTPGTYVQRVSVGRGPRPAGQNEYYTLTGLDFGAQYYLAISAYDKSGNVSPGLSAEIGGNPVPSLRSASEADNAGRSDTTITLLPPPAPTGLAAAPLVNAVTLTWSRAPVPGLKGYRLYRSLSENFAPSDDPATGNRIANEIALDQNAASFTDTGLLGCTPYHYKLAAIACDGTIPTATMNFATVSASPLDNTPPPTPTLTAKSGFRRIILNVENPLLATSPDFVHTRIWFKLGSEYPTLGPDGQTTDGTLIPDHAGLIAGDGTVAINFDSTTQENPGPPSLDRDATYSFLAVAYDRCGNHSDVTAAAQALGNQCGDGPIGPPSAPMGLDAEGCFDPMTLTWTGPDPIAHPDFTGYHVFRCDKSADLCGYPCVSPSTSLPAPGWTEVTGAYLWSEHYTDTIAKGLQAGHDYAYCVQVTDCYYEENRWTWPQPGDDAANDPKDNFTETILADPVSVGRLELDTSLPDAVSGYLLPGTSQRPFTVDAAAGLTPVNPNFQHNTVSFWLRNTANSPFTLRQLATSWEKPDAYLRRFAFGDGSTTHTTTGWEGTASSGAALTLTASQILAGDEKVPAVDLFRDVDGNLTRAADARQQTVEFTLNYRNDSTGTEGCGLTGSFYVPLGPYLYGTSQDQPAAGTRSWPVPGETGNDVNVITANGGANVSVFTNVYDSSGYGVTPGLVKLYYYVDSGRTLTTAPALVDTALFPVLPPYTSIDLVPVAGNLWRTPVAQPIPAHDGSNVWYFIVAVDNQGNFDRDPEPDAGAFQYYQQPADVCGTIPDRPTLVGADADGGSVTLTFWPPPRNTNGSAYSDRAGLKVYRRKNSESWELRATVADGGPGPLTHVDNVGSDAYTSVYSYRVTAYDSCRQGANEGPSSALYTERMEEACTSTPAPPYLCGSTDAAGRVTLTWTAPTVNASGTPLEDLASYAVWRRSGAGLLTKVADGIAAGSTLTTYTDPNPPAAPLADIATADYSFFVTAADSCSPTPRVSASSNPYIDQVIATDPCVTTPSMPVNLAIEDVSATGDVTVTWTAPTTQTDGTPYNDAAQYQLFWSEWDASGTFTGKTRYQMIPLSCPPRYTDTSVRATVGSLRYKYWIQAVDRCGRGSTWHEGPYETFSDACGSIPGKPLALSASALDSSGVELFWSPPNPLPEDLAGYWIERRLGSGAWQKVAETSGGNTSYKDFTATDAGLSGVTYSYQVRAFDSCATRNYGPFSDPASESYTDPCESIAPPAAPTGLDAEVVGSCNAPHGGQTPKNSPKAYLSWNPVAAPTSPSGVSVGYKVYYCEAPTASGSCLPATEVPARTPIQLGSGADRNMMTTTVDIGYPLEGTRVPPSTGTLTPKKYIFGVESRYLCGSTVKPSLTKTAIEDPCP